MPANPALIDYLNLRFDSISNHVLQSANRAMKTGMTEDIVLACLLHDVVQELIKADHSWWGAQMFAPYVSEKTAFAIRYHQALRFYEDKENGYEYPDLYRNIFGEDYKPEPYPSTSSGNSVGSADLPETRGVIRCGLRLRLVPRSPEIDVHAA